MVCNSDQDPAREQMCAEALIAELVLFQPQLEVRASTAPARRLASVGKERR